MVILAKNSKRNNEAQLKRFGKHLAKLIESQGYKSPYEFWIEKAGDDISRASLNYIVAGKREAKLLTILKLAENLEISPGELLKF